MREFLLIKNAVLWEPEKLFWSASRKIIKVIILLDEYDTPMQEAYVHGYWKELAGLIKGIFHSAFKTNLYLDRAVLTGITRVRTPAATVWQEN